MTKRDPDCAKPAPRLLAVLAALAALALPGCDQVKSWFKPTAPDIKFAPYADEYPSKTDLAQVEYKYPLSTAELAKITESTA